MRGGRAERGRGIVWLEIIGPKHRRPRKCRSAQSPADCADLQRIFLSPTLRWRLRQSCAQPGPRFVATSMGSSQIRVAVDRPLATVFAVYTQPDTWGWCSYIRSARWVRGRPWEEGSRLSIEVDDSTTVDQALMHFEPSRRVEFISHFAGVTLETRVMFLAASEQETEIEVQLEFVGVFSRIAGFAT